MSFSYSNASIENLKQQVNIVDVIGSVVPLKKAGSNHKGVCPFHNEKTPSFVVSEQKQIFTCFGCGASGDLIEFVKRYYNLEFGEAVEKIANQYNITMEKNSYDNNRDEFYNINKLAARFFYKAFTEKANKGYAYMKNRGISVNTLKKFGIGYADEKWDSLYNYMTSQHIDKNKLLELGLISESKGKYYDKFRNRVIFPIINTSGKVIGFGGRAIDSKDNPKYLNSPESKIFQKKNNLYGLNVARQNIGKDGYIILVEGYMDTISLFQSGITNVSASLGTALTENQAKLLKRYTNEVILSYDADSAGQAAALRGLDILKKEECKVKVLHVDDGKDPDEFIKKNGKNEFLKLVEKALPYGEYKLKSAQKGFNLLKDEDKIYYLKKVTAILRQLSPIEQDVYIKKLSKELKISEGAIKMELNGKDSTESKPFIPKKNETKEISNDLSNLERTLIKVMLTNDSYLERIAEHKGILVSQIGTRVFDLALEQISKNQFLDVKKILDDLTPNDAVILQDIIDQVKISGNEEQVFTDCIRKWEIDSLTQEEEKLITMLSIADEEQNEDKIKELQYKLIQVQQKILKQQ